MKYSPSLAGTRPRGKTEAEDRALEAELLADEKELAEHNMLVDLGRNDLGKISQFGTVQVEKLHSIERYSHVMHIGSTIRGQIRQDCDALDAVSAVLPTGTLSGCLSALPWIRWWGTGASCRVCAGHHKFCISAEMEQEVIFVPQMHPVDFSIGLC